MTCGRFSGGDDACPDALFLLGLERAPCHAMYHYFFKALDIAATERVLGEWVRASGPAGHVALDGKRLRGSAPAGHDGSAGVHLLAAFATRLGGVIGQLQVPPDGNEITTALALLKALPLQGTVITGDAAVCQRSICQSIRDRQGDYLFAVKANQPELMANIARLWRRFSPRNWSRLFVSRRRRSMTWCAARPCHGEHERESPWSHRDAHHHHQPRVRGPPELARRNSRLPHRAYSGAGRYRQPRDRLCGDEPAR